MRYSQAVTAVVSMPCAAGATVGAQAVIPTFDAVYAAHAAWVWQALRRHGVQESAVDDATQDVFVVIHRQLPKFESRSRIETWIYGIVIRVARDHRRRHARKGHGDPLDESIASTAPSPLESAARAEAAALFVLLLETLDENKRDVFVMSELEGMSVPEMAEVLGVNPNTLYSRVRAARAEFEEAVQAWQAAHPTQEAP